MATWSEWSNVESDVSNIPIIQFSQSSTYGGNFTIDAKNYISNYADITIDNFFFKSISVSRSGVPNLACSAAASIVSYDSSDGTLTFSVYLNANNANSGTVTASIAIVNGKEI